MKLYRAHLYAVAHNIPYLGKTDLVVVGIDRL